MNYDKKCSAQPKRPGSVGQQQSAQSHGNNNVNKPGPKVRLPPGVRKRVVHPDLSAPLSKLTIKDETDEDKKKQLWKDLNKCETPFIWAPRHVKPLDSHEAAIARLKEKDEEVKDEKRFKWRKFIFHLVMSYESLLAGHSAEESLASLDMLEQELRVQTNTNLEWQWLGVKHALGHIVLASKAYVYLTMDRLQEATQILSRVLPVHCLKPASQAAIHGVRAAVFSEYGHTGNKAAVEEALKAVELDRTAPEWHFLLGKCLGRIRRVATCHDLVTEEEVSAINKASNYDSTNALYKVYVGQVLREKAFRELRLHQWKTGTPEYKKIYQIYFAAKSRYVDAVKLRPDCPHVLTRCAFGLMKLPLNLVKLPEVRTLIDKALELAPRNMMTHHVKALYFERYTTELEEALREMEIAAELGNFGAAMDLIRMHYLMHCDGIVEELFAVASRFGEECRVQVALTQAGSYLLFVKKDFIQAAKCFIKVLEIDPKSYAMKSHKSKFVRMKYPVNMFEVLYEELDHRTDRNSFSREDKATLTKLRVLIREHVPTDGRECLSVQDILEMAHKQINWEQREPTKKRRGRKRVWKGKGLGKKMKKGEKKEAKDDKKKAKKVYLNKKNDYWKNPAIYGAIFANSDIRQSERNHQSSRQQGERQYASESSSRASSVSCSSYSSGPDISEKLSNFHIGPRVTHNSRFSQSQANSGLTVENLRRFNAANPSLARPQSPSCSSVETLTVMERVQQSYAMLGRPSNDKRQGKKKYRSESTQSVNRSGRAGPVDHLNRSFSNMSLQRTGSTQSLNIPTYKPNFPSRDLSTESSRSQLFLPSFAKKPEESKKGNSAENNSSSLFMPNYAKKPEESDKG